MQGLQQDIVAYEHMMDLVRQRAHDLASNGSAVTMETERTLHRYQALRERAQVTMAMLAWHVDTLLTSSLSFYSNDVCSEQSKQITYKSKDNIYKIYQQQILFISYCDKDIYGVCPFTNLSEFFQTKYISSKIVLFVIFIFFGAKYNFLIG